MPLTTPAMPIVSSGRPHRLPLSTKAGGNRAVDVGEFVRSRGAVGPAGAHEDPEIGRDLLLDIDAHSAAALIVADGGDIGGPPVISGQARWRPRKSPCDRGSGIR